MSDKILVELNDTARQQIDDIIQARVSDIGSSLEEKIAALIPKPEEPETAVELERESAIGQIMKTEVWGIPIGEAAIGGFFAIVATELIDGFMSAQTAQMRGVVKLVSAGVIAQWGKRIPFLGSYGSKILALFITFDALRDITPLNEWAAKIAEAITGVFPTAGLAGNLRRGSVVNQAEQVASGYYSSVAGRMG